MSESDIPGACMLVVLNAMEGFVGLAFERGFWLMSNLEYVTGGGVSCTAYACLARADLKVALGSAVAFCSICASENKVSLRSR